MPPKKKGANTSKPKPGEEDREEPLQAVVLADSFETRFNPFTIERPRCLLPLANTPLIEYTLEFLANAGVEEIYLYCGNHTDQVEDYLNHSKWTKDTAPFSLEIIRSTSRSIGDAMRDLDQKGLINRDFICVYGDVVANFPLESALRAHRARRAKDKNAVMTMVLREAGDSHRTKAQHMRACFVIDPDKERCVHYEQVYPREAPRLDISDEVLRENVEVEIREDLIDCGIDICTPEVLAQWSDNFDWQMPRRGFLYGVLKDYETNRLTIHTHILTDGYAARVKNLQAFDAITKDVVSRWTYPLCPDTNMLEGHSYQLGKGNVYKEDGVVLARSSVIARKSVVGRETSIGEGSTITNSIIGRRCNIGKRVKISNSYIWDDAHVGDGTTIEHAIIANEASVGKNCTVHKGALISYRVTIANNTTVDQDKRITRSKRKHDTDVEEVITATSDPHTVGDGAHGFLLDLDSEEEDAADCLLLSSLDISPTAPSISDPESSSEDDDDDLDPTTSLDPTHARRSSRSESFASINSDDSSGAHRAAAAEFHAEAVAGMLDALHKHEAPDTVQLELRALTLSSNAAGKSVRRAVAVALARRMVSLVDPDPNPNTTTTATSTSPSLKVSPKEAVAQTISPYRLVVKGCVGPTDVAEQAEFLLALQTELATRAAGASAERLWLFAALALVTEDLVVAEGVEAWWEHEGKSGATERMKAVREGARGLVETLVGGSEEEEEEESEDDDDDE